LVKVCLKHITRKDSVVKITSLIGKNMTSTKTYQDVVPAGEIPDPSVLALSVNPDFDAYLLGLITVPSS
jgi:hypothetical protein